MHTCIRVYFTARNRKTDEMRSRKQIGKRSADGATARVCVCACGEGEGEETRDRDRGGGRAPKTDGCPRDRKKRLRREHSRDFDLPGLFPVVFPSPRQNKETARGESENAIFVRPSSSDSYENGFGLNVCVRVRVCVCVCVFFFFDFFPVDVAANGALSYGLKNVFSRRK